MQTDNSTGSKIVDPAEVLLAQCGIPALASIVPIGPLVPAVTAGIAAVGEAVDREALVFAHVHVPLGLRGVVRGQRR